MKKMLFLFCMALGVAFASCGDAELAQKTDGKWYNVSEMKDDEGVPYTQHMLFQFDYVENSSMDGGKFTEWRSVEQAYEEDGLRYSATVSSSVSGTWEVLAGDLYVTYNIGTLEVSVDDADIRLSKDADLETVEMMLDGTFYELGMLDKKAFVKEVYSNTYSAMRLEYELHNADEACWEDLQIEGDNLSFMTGDMGRVTFYRYTEDADQNAEESTQTTEFPPYVDSQQSADGKYDYTIHTKEDEYGEEIWLCVKKKSDSKYKETLLVENVMDGLRYVDYAPLADGTVQVRCLDGQDLCRVVTTRYDATLTDELGSENSEYEEISFSNAKKHEDKGDYRLAFVYCRDLALKSDPSVQGEVGYYYFVGQGVERNIEEGLKWIRKAADQGVASAQYNLGYCYLEGMGVRKDKAQACHWLQLAADQGDEDAQDLLKEL